MLARLLWLSLGTFAIGAETFIVAGVLPDIATDLHTSLTACGQLVTAYALTYAIGSPVLATLFAQLPRKSMLIGALLAFAAANVLAAIATNLTLLMGARVLLGLSAGLFIPTANAVAVALVPPEMRGRAIATVIGGITVAAAVGAPIGTLIAAYGTWRTPFLFIAGVTMVAALGLVVGLPRNLPRSRASLAERVALAGKQRVLSALLVTLLWSLSIFVLFTYIAPFLQSEGVTGLGLSLAFLVMGIASAIGNAYGGIVVDRLGSVRTLATSLGALVVVMLALSLVAKTIPLPAGSTVAVVLIALWGLAGWIFYPAQGSRLVEVAPEAPVVALSLNSSALFFGQAGGAAIGSATLAVGQLSDLAWVGAAFALVGLAALTWSARLASNAVPAPAE